MAQARVKRRKRPGVVGKFQMARELQELGDAIYELNGKKFYSVTSLRKYLEELMERYKRTYRELRRKEATARSPVLKAKYRNLAKRYLLKLTDLREFYRGLSMCRKMGLKGKRCVYWALMR